MTVTRHFLDRCEERWGFLPSEAEVLEVLRQIREYGEPGGAVLLRSRTRRGGRVYLVQVRGMGREVVWFAGRLVTAKPTPPLPWARVEAFIREAS